MARLTYHRGPRLKSKTQATGNADGPWLDDKTTSQYEPAAGNQLRRGQSLQRTAALSAANPPPSAATGQQVGPTEQRANAAIERFWREQTPSRRMQIMARVFDPPWVRALAALVGIAMCVVFGWVLVAGPELPSFTPKTKTLVPAMTESLAAVPGNAASQLKAADDTTSADLAQPTAAASSAPPLDAPNEAAPLASAAQPAATATHAVPLPGKQASRNKRDKHPKSAADGQRNLAVATSGRPATLRINSRPGSEVFVDDKSFGHTPQLSISLEPGVHNVRLHNRQRNLLKILTLHVLPGETIDRVELLDP